MNLRKVKIYLKAMCLTFLEIKFNLNKLNRAFLNCKKEEKNEKASYFGFNVRACF